MNPLLRSFIFVFAVTAIRLFASESSAADSDGLLKLTSKIVVSAPEHGGGNPKWTMTIESFLENVGEHDTTILLFDRDRIVHRGDILAFVFGTGYSSDGRLLKNSLCRMSPVILRPSEIAPLPVFSMELDLSKLPANIPKELRYEIKNETGKLYGIWSGYLKQRLETEESINAARQGTEKRGGSNRRDR